MEVLKYIVGLHLEGYCELHTSISSLSKFLGLNRRKVSKSLQKLIDIGLLGMELGNRRSGNRYIFKFKIQQDGKQIERKIKRITHKDEILSN